MKKSTKIFAGVALASLVGILLFATRRRKARDHRDRSALVVDEGYETTYDIHFPNKVYGKSKSQQASYK